MANTLIGNKANHPSLKLTAGQVKEFKPWPKAPVSSICPFCGRLITNATYHPNA